MYFKSKLGSFQRPIAQSSVPLKNKLCSFLTMHAALQDAQLNSTALRTSNSLNNDVTQHVTHSSCQARTMRKKFPIKASVESMSHVLDLRFGLRLYTYIYWSTSTMSHRRMSYTASEKLAIVKYAKAHGNRAAGWQYDGVSESNIWLWRSEESFNAFSFLVLGSSKLTINQSINQNTFL